MRRVFFIVLGLLEIAVAAVLIVLGTRLPRRGEIEAGFDGAERVTRNAGIQARLLRRQVQDLRRPELEELAQRLQKQTHTVTAMLRQQHVNFDNVRTMRDALGEVADGLDAMAATFDGSNIRKLGDGLGVAAGFLEEEIIPGAARTAEQLKASTQQRRSNAKQFAQLLKTAPPDLKDDLARLLRDSGQLKGTARALRQAQKSIETAVEHWPELQAALQRSARLLRLGQGQLTHVTEHRQDYENALQQSVVLVESFAALLPLLTDQLDNRLDEEESALNNLELSLGEVEQALPLYARSAESVLDAGRWLAWLVALVVALHGTYLLLSARLGRRFSF